MDPISMGVGPYGFAGGYDPALFQIMNEYEGVVSQYTGGLPGTTTPAPATTQTYPAYGSEEYWTQIRENQDRMMDNTIEQQKRWQTQPYVTNGPMNKVAKASDMLRDKILENEQDQIQYALKAYKTAIKEAYYPNEEEVEDELLTAQAKTYYESRFGVRIEDDLRANATPAFWNGFVKSATFGLFGDDVTAAENIAKMNDQPVSSKQKTWKKTGKVVGCTTVGTAVGVGVALAGAKIGAAIGAAGGPIGIGAGALIGALAGLAIGLFKK